MKSLLAASLLSLTLSPAALADEAGSVSAWRTNHAVAAQSFDRWTQADPQSQAVLAFTTDHPGRTRALIAWALANPTGQLADFNSSHGNAAKDLANSPNGAAHLLDWARQNPEAAKELANSPKGLATAVAQK